MRVALLAGDEAGVHELVDTGNINLRHPLPHDPDHKYPLHCAGQSDLGWYLRTWYSAAITIVWSTTDLVVTAIVAMIPRCVYASLISFLPPHAS